MNTVDLKQFNNYFHHNIRTHQKLTCDRKKMLESQIKHWKKLMIYLTFKSCKKQKFHLQNTQR